MKLPQTTINVKRGDIVKVDFADHVQRSGKTLRFHVYGRVLACTQHHLTIETWGYADARRKRDANCDYYTIVKAAINRIVRLREVKQED